MPPDASSPGKWRPSGIVHPPLPNVFIAAVRQEGQPTSSEFAWWRFFPTLCDSAACVGRSESMDEKTMTKVKDLTPASKQVNVLVKVVGLSEEREITSKFGEARKLVEATVGDETATVLLTLWNDQIGQVQTVETVNTALDVSAVEYEREPRYRSGGYSGERRSGSGGGDRQFEFGTFGGGRGGGGSGGGGRDRDRRDRGRRRF